MNVAFALQYIPQRMRELGHGDQYLLRWRTLQLDAQETRIIEAPNEYYLFIHPSSSFMIQSKLGIYDLTDKSINEMQFEHRGRISIYNRCDDSRLLIGIQIIPHHVPQPSSNPTP